MFKRLLVCMAIVVFSLFYREIEVVAQQLSDFQHPDVKMMIVYSEAEHNEKHPRVLELDLLLGHFTTDITIKHVDEIEEKDFDDKTHVFYYGISEDILERKTIQLFEAFHGNVILIGENAEQFPTYKKLDMTDNVIVNSVSSLMTKSKHNMKNPLKIKKINEKNAHNVLLYGEADDKQQPIFVRADKRRYYLTIDSRLNSLSDVIKNYFAEMLHHIIPNNHQSGHTAYMRLEDIHPLSDPELLLEVGEYLNERQIPFMLVVIPVYINPETYERIYLSEKKELMDVLHYLQDTGGTVISHGYTHQYYDQETGEGFEFWDVRHNQFIMSEEPTESELLLSRHEFRNNDDYDLYLSQYKQVESSYVRNRIEQAINELVYLKLYPLAFEAPHYTMSQQGYSIVGEYYSTILGQMQMSDDNWEIMTSTPYVTTAHFLNGMTLYPETAGFYDPSLIDPTLDTKQQLDSLLVVRDGFIGAFFHPYLGVENLKKFLKQFEDIPNLTWMNLKETEQVVETDKITIKSDDTGIIKVNNMWGRWEYFIEQRKNSPLENILWGVTALVALFVIIFLCIALYLRLNVKKKLFDERTP